MTVYGANTLEDLAGYLGYAGECGQNFVKTIEHYNTLCQKGVDSDFGKDARAMIPIDEPPFYGCAYENDGTMTPILSTVAGILTDNRLRALDKDGNPIKGLFAAGNTLGGRYGLGYSTPFAGNSIGMALTHGWLAGKFAAED
jgi:succinate dehydrogenase/fumarate reductase flavoprotein subunit